MDSEDRKWLQCILNEGSGELSDEDLQVLLCGHNASEEALLAGIGFVRTWLSRKALVPLFEIVVSSHSRKVRWAAASALGQICDESTKEIITQGLLGQPKGHEGNLKGADGA